MPLSYIPPDRVKKNLEAMAQKAQARKNLNTQLTKSIKQKEAASGPYRSDPSLGLTFAPYKDLDENERRFLVEQSVNSVAGITGDVQAVNKGLPIPLPSNGVKAGQSLPPALSPREVSNIEGVVATQLPVKNQVVSVVNQIGIDPNIGKQNFIKTYVEKFARTRNKLEIDDLLEEAEYLYGHL